MRYLSRSLIASLLVTMAAVGAVIGPQATHPANAQTQADIDAALANLSEILGALAHLEPLCSQTSQSRDDMQALLASEELSPLRQAVLVDAFNRGFRGVANIHQHCTSASERLIERHHQRGASIVGTLLGE